LRRYNDIVRSLQEKEEAKLLELKNKKTRCGSRSTSLTEHHTHRSADLRRH
jgi:hypothetical protein